MTAPATKASKSKSGEGPVHLKTWDEVDAYYKKHLKPIRLGPKGQPIYRHEDVMALNVILPDHK